jgi:hypothetical protein
MMGGEEMRRLLIGCLTAWAGLALAFVPAAGARQGDPLVELITDSFEVHGDGHFHEFKVICPTGHSATMGTLRGIQPGVYLGSSESTGPNGRTWTFHIEFSGPGSTAVPVQVRCVDDIVFKPKEGHVSVDANTPTQGKTPGCPNGFKALGRGERASKPGPPNDDLDDPYFQAFMAFYTGDEEFATGVDAASDPFDYYFFVYCGKVDNSDKAAARHLKVTTVSKNVHLQVANFGLAKLRCPKGTLPTSGEFPKLPSGVSGFLDIPGTAHTQSVEFLNGSGHPQDVKAKLLCIKAVR